MNIAMRYANSYDNAVEMVNDGFLKVFNDVKNFQSITSNINISFTAWLKRVMINASIDHLRKYRRKEMMMSVSIDEVNTEVNVTYIQDRFVTNDILRCIAKLPTAYRTVFNLYVIEGFTHREIADFLNINEGTSKSNLFKAREVLRKLLAKTNINYGQQSI